MSKIFGKDSLFNISYVNLGGFLLSLDFIAKAGIDNFKEIIAMLGKDRIINFFEDIRKFDPVLLFTANIKYIRNTYPFIIEEKEIFQEENIKKTKDILMNMPEVPSVLGCAERDRDLKIYFLAVLRIQSKLVNSLDKEAYDKLIIIILTQATFARIYIGLQLI